jgi:hypothetical protein
MHLRLKCEVLFGVYTYLSEPFVWSISTSGGIVAETFDIKFKIIFARESSIAKSVALSLIKTKPITVWEIMIPVIFILNFVKIKQSREVFIQNHLFTKELALRAAFDMVKKAQSKKTAMTKIKSKTKEILSSVTSGIYSDDIRSEQIKEIDLLIDHYSKLFKVEGEDYFSLIIGAYQTREDYAAFLKHLQSAENKVIVAAQRTLGVQADMKAASQLEMLTERVRAAELEKIFKID